MDSLPTASSSSPAPSAAAGSARTSSQDRFAAILLAETVRLVEQDGPLEDQDLMREVFHGATGADERLLMRAGLLGSRLRLDRELARWRGAAWLIALLLALFAFLSAYGIAVSVIGSGRTINAVTAFFATLALPTLTLIIWAAAVVSRGGGMFGHLSFGNMLLWLLGRLPGERHPHGVTMAHAAFGLLQRRRLIPWAFGMVSHMVWAVAFMLVLVVLGFAFSFHAYRLTWETTLLDAEFFVRFVTFTGTLPSWLGFPLPDPATLRDPYAPGTDQRAWAWWLIGCVFTYGLLPRCVLCVASWFAWRHEVQGMHLDTSEPYYRKLLARFDAMEQSVIEDVERRVPPESRTSAAAHANASHGGAIVGFELPPEIAWPPQPLPQQLALVERISGTAAERRALLDRLAGLRPRMLLVVCHAASTPDRGTERFLREAARHATRLALLLAAAVDDSGGIRWRKWLAQTGLEHVDCFTDSERAAAWMDGADE